MGKLKCPCGEILSNSGWPNETTGWLTTCWRLERIDDSSDVMDGRGMWECKSCGRIAFDFPNPGDATVKWYVPEDGKPGGLNNREADA